VLGPVGGVAEGLGAAGELAHVGLLPRVGPQVGLQVLQPAVRLPATLKLKKEKVNQSIEIFENNNRHFTLRRGFRKRGGG
jgi:hypothetical protein